MRIVPRVQRAFACKAALLSAATLCSGSIAFAGIDADRTKEIEARQSSYIAKLEARIRNLEKTEERFRNLEKKIEFLNSKLAARDSGPQWRSPVVSARGNSPPKAGPGGDPSVAIQPTNAATPAALADKDDADALRDLTVIRDQAVTVKKGGIDLGFNAKYVRMSTYAQFSRAIIGTTSIRYGIFPGSEISLTVPAYLATRSTQLGPDYTFTTDIKAVGDISGQVTSSLFKETVDWPGVFAYASVTAPTGPNPYWVKAGQRPYAQPVDPLYFTQSSGHWNGTVGVTFVKTLEPIIMFGGLSYTHYLKRDFAGSTMQPADRYGYNFGFGLAVSERTMLGASVQGIYQKNLVMDGIPRMGTSAESVILNLSLSQRIAMGFFFEPSVGIGMTSDAPSATITVGARKSF